MSDPIPLMTQGQRNLVRDIIKDPLADGRKWTVQGFGMLRTYLDPETERFRLNVWDDRFRTESVSTIHDHAWHFTSWVLSGMLTNHRYVERDIHDGGTRYHYAEIKTGEGGGHSSARVSTIYLDRGNPESYLAGECYSQRADELHQTVYVNGTVTLNDRRLADGQTNDRKIARVAWIAGDWVSAEPRPATDEEVSSCLADARAHWSL